MIDRIVKYLSAQKFAPVWSEGNHIYGYKKEKLYLAIYQSKVVTDDEAGLIQAINQYGGCAFWVSSMEDIYLHLTIDEKIFKLINPDNIGNDELQIITARFWDFFKSTCEKFVVYQRNSSHGYQYMARDTMKELFLETLRHNDHLIAICRDKIQVMIDRGGTNSDLLGMYNHFLSNKSKVGDFIFQETKKGLKSKQNYAIIKSQKD